MPDSVRPKTDRRRSTRTPRSLSLTVTVSNEPSAQDIAQRAFELYCERGRQDGGDLDDWLRAERELTAGQRQPKRRTTRKPVLD